MKPQRKNKRQKPRKQGEIEGLQKAKTSVRISAKRTKKKEKRNRYGML